MKKHYLREGSLVLLGYAILTVILTYPSVFYLSSRFMGNGRDGFQNMWNLWWVKTALLDLHTNPYYTDMLYYPTGVTLLFHSLSPLNGLISIPLQHLFNMEVTYNLLMLFSFVMSGVSMYLLARYLTGYKAAAFIAGAIFSFSPYHFAHTLGHVNLAHMEWLPLYVLYMVKTFDQPKRGNAVLAGIFLILNALCSWYYALFALVFTAVFVGYKIVQEKAVGNGPYLRAVAISMLVFGLTMSPIVGPMVYARFTQDMKGGHDPSRFSADLASFFVPGKHSSYGKYFRAAWSQWSWNATESQNYIGYLVLGFSVYGMLRVRSARFWGGTGIVFLILALGPYLRILGHGDVRRVPLPYLLLHEYVFPFSLAGVPARFDIMLKLCLAVVVSYAISDLLCRIEGQKRRIIVLSMIGVGVISEYLCVPYPMTKVEVPAFYRILGRDSERYGVIDVPFRSQSLTMYLATIHGKPMVGGYISRPPLEALDFVKTTPVIKNLLGGVQWDQSQDNIAEVGRKVFDEYDIRYVIVHNDKKVDFLEKDLNLPLVHADQRIRVYAASSTTRKSHAQHNSN